MVRRRRCSAGWCSSAASGARTSPCSPRRWRWSSSLILIGQLKTFAGTNGLTDFKTVFGRNKYDPDTNTFLYYLAAGVLVVVFLVGWTSCAAASAGCCGRPRRRGPGPLPRLRPGGGQDGRVRRRRRHGRRGRGAGRADHRHRRPEPVRGAAVDPDGLLGRRRRARHAVRGGPRRPRSSTGARPRVSESWPDDWQYLQGLLFIVVVAFVPGGIVGLVQLDRATAAERGRDRRRRCRPRSRRPSRRPSPEAAGARP